MLNEREECRADPTELLNRRPVKVFVLAKQADSNTGFLLKWESLEGQNLGGKVLPKRRGAGQDERRHT